MVKVDNPPTWIGVVHGWVYFIYLIFTANLAVKVRWPIGKTIGVLLAGTIPLLGIIVEHFQTTRDQGPVQPLISRQLHATPAPTAPAPGRDATPRPSPAGLSCAALRGLIRPG